MGKSFSLVNKSFFGSKNEEIRSKKFRLTKQIAFFDLVDFKIDNKFSMFLLIFLPEAVFGVSLFSSLLLVKLLQISLLVALSVFWSIEISNITILLKFLITILYIFAIFKNIWISITNFSFG